MTDRVTNQMLTRQITHLTQYLPNKEELNGTPRGSGYFRKVNDHGFCEAFKISHQRLNALKEKYLLTEEQMSFINEAQIQLIHEIQDAYGNHDCLPKSMQQFLSHNDKTNGAG